MVKLLIGRKGSGKTNAMVSMANENIETANGSVVFINKDHRLMYDLKYRIRVICMEDYEEITNADEYVGFILGITSQDRDIETIYIDSILKHAGMSVENIGAFLERLAAISEKISTDFVVSVSASKEELGDAAEKYTILN